MRADLGDFCGKDGQKASYRMRLASGTFYEMIDSSGLSCVQTFGGLATSPLLNRNRDYAERKQQERSDISD